MPEIEPKKCYLLSTVTLTKKAHILYSFRIVESTWKGLKGRQTYDETRLVSDSCQLSARGHALSLVNGLPTSWDCGFVQTYSFWLVTDITVHTQYGNYFWEVWWIPALQGIWFSKFSIEMLFRRHMTFNFNNEFFHLRPKRDFLTNVCIVYIGADLRIWDKLFEITYPKMKLFHSQT